MDQRTLILDDGSSQNGFRICLMVMQNHFYTSFVWSKNSIENSNEKSTGLPFLVFPKIQVRKVRQ